MDRKAVAVFTFRSIDYILAVGGTSAWTLNRANARQLPFVVCTRNTHHKDTQGSEAHGSAFMVGRLKDIVPAPENRARWLITFSEYALIDLPDAWKGWRNPVRYTSLEELGIDPNTLRFEPMPEPNLDALSGTMIPAPEEADEDGAEAVMKLTIAEAKTGLAAAFGVRTDQIEIVIKA